MGGLARKIPITFATFAVATAAIAGIPPLAGFFSKDEILWFAFASSRGGSPLLFVVGRDHGAADGVLHVPAAVAHVLRRVADDAEAEHHVHESPASMTGVLVVLAIAVGDRRLPVDPAFPRAAAAVARRRAERSSTSRRPLVVRLDRAALSPDSLRAAYLFGGDADARRAPARARFPTLHRVLSGKYYVDEAYDRLIGRPLYWISDRVFLQPRRPRRFRRLAARPRRARPAHRRRSVPRADRQPASVRAARALRHHRLARVELAAMADAALLNVVLFLPLPALRRCSRCPRGSDDLVRRLSLAMMFAAVRADRVALHRASTRPSAACNSRRGCPGSPAWGVYYQIGLDGYNVLLVLLTAFLGPLVVAGAFTAISKDVKLFYAMVFALQFAMLGTFVAQDLFLFYLFWEAMLIPLFLIIGIWGGERRIYATLKFVLYTAFGSILMLAAVIYLVLFAQRDDRRDVVRLRRPVSRRAAAAGADAPARRFRAVVRDQGADRAAAHVAPRRARRGADRGLGDPRRRAAEDGDVRLHEARLPAVPRCDAAARAALQDARGREHPLRRVPGARCRPTSRRSSPTRRSATWAT